jgi:hypothetical protein
MSPIIKIQSKLFDQCEECAKQRLANCKKQKRHDRCNYLNMDRKEEKHDYALQKEIEGIIGEVSIFSFFKLGIDWNYICGLAGFGKVDVPPVWEVKTMKPRNRLYILPSDCEPHSLSYAYSKVGITFPEHRIARCELMGWKMGYEINQQAELLNLGYIDTPSYYLNNSLLRPHTSPDSDMELAVKLNKLFWSIHETHL